MMYVLGVGGSSILATRPVPDDANPYPYPTHAENCYPTRLSDSSTVYTGLNFISCWSYWRPAKPYEVALSLTQFASLHDHWECLNKKIFHLHNYSVFLYLLPPPSTQRLQHHLQITYSIPIPTTRTKCYPSFIYHALFKLSVLHTLTLPPSYLKIHSFIVIL